MDHREARACWVAVAAFLLAAASPVFADAYLIKDGLPQAEIIIGEKPARMAHLAARELQENLQKISGAKLPVKTAPTDGCPMKKAAAKVKTAAKKTKGVAKKAMKSAKKSTAKATKKLAAKRKK